MDIERIGHYLDREVQLACAKDPSELQARSLSHSTVCLWLGGQLVARQRTRLVERVLSATPLATCICGIGAEDFFDQLLVRLATPEQSTPMMTSFNAASLSVCVEEYFIATWPPEERWDGWSNHQLIVYGADPTDLRSAALKFLRGAEHTAGG